VSRSAIALALSAWLGAVLAPPATTQTCTPPSNEDCAGALAFTFAQLPFSHAGLLGCTNDMVDRPYFDVFFRYDCTASGLHEFGLCDSDGDTYIRIYTGGCGFADGEEFAVGDDECPSSPPNADPLIAVTLTEGTPYWIEVGTWRPDPPWGAPNLPYTLTVRRFCPADITGAAGTPDGTVDMAATESLRAGRE